MRLDGWELLPAVLLLWVVPAFLVAYFASKKQRRFVDFLVISLIVGWLIPALVVLVTRRDSAALTRSCPYCAELVQNEAKLCQHCGKDLPVNETFKSVKPSRIEVLSSSSIRKFENAARRWAIFGLFVIFIGFIYLVLSVLAQDRFILALSIIAWHVGAFLVITNLIKLREIWARQKANE